MAREPRIVQWLRARRWPSWLTWRWLRWALVPLVPLLGINLSAGFFGNSLVFPLSPFFLREKAGALALYFLHRPHCFFEGHVDLAPVIARAERQHHLPPGLLAAVVQVESNARVHRISFAGAMGPAQLTRSTARLLKVTDPFDPEQNIDGAARYLAIQWKRFHDLRLVAAAYNAGPGAVVNRQVPRNGETELYVIKVLRAMGPRAQEGHPPTRGGRPAPGPRARG
ncbi:MAG TPA: lytic transglycosylase domain-containing protein [Polyangia bacterium]|nr:lytic transglycosylase domain-containing protein [Polyangia bacterium]